VEVTSNQTEVQDPLTLKYQITNRLYWSPLLNGCEISVSVDDDGVATMTGWVSDASQFKAAKRIALDSGATKVDNRLLIGK
jgi:osmotically-inducible protein OsmY